MIHICIWLINWRPKSVIRHVKLGWMTIYIKIKGIFYKMKIIETSIILRIIIMNIIWNRFISWDHHFLSISMGTQWVDQRHWIVVPYPYLYIFVFVIIQIKMSGMIGDRRVSAIHIQYTKLIYDIRGLYEELKSCLNNQIYLYICIWSILHSTILSTNIHVCPYLFILIHTRVYDTFIYVYLYLFPRTMKNRTAKYW